jgi:predicted metal-dependent peptidase
MAKLTPQQRLDRLHVSLLRDDRTLIMSGILMMGKSEITEDPRIPTACTDGVNKMYDAKFTAALDDSEARCVVMHENLHVLFKHTLVWKHLWEKNPRKANIAADYVVNGFIRKLDPSEVFLKPPRNHPPAVWLFDEKYLDMDVGEVYRRLPENEEEGDGQSSGHGGADTHDWEALDELTQAEIDALGKEIDQAIRQGAVVAGKVSAGKDRTFDALMEPKVDWRKVMREFISQHCDGRDESTWRKPNRRWLQYDTYLPSMQGVATGDIVVAIDTSGSTYVGGMLEKFLSELSAIAAATNPEKLHVIYWESDVAAHEVYNRDEMGSVIARTKPKGGGGTTTSCVTAYMRTHNIKPKACVVLTDGYVGNDWGGTWPSPVLWVIVGNKTAQPGVGVVVHAED